jgi:hypothetical protein
MSRSFSRPSRTLRVHTAAIAEPATVLYLLIVGVRTRKPAAERILAAA